MRFAYLASLMFVLTMSSTSLAQYVPTYFTTLGSTTPATATGFSFERNDPPGNTITTSQTQTWSGGSFDTGSLSPGDVIGFVSVSSFIEDDLVANLTVDTADPTGASMSAVVVEVSNELLQQIVLAGGTDPTGSSIGTLTLSNGPLNELTLAAPELFPPTAAPTFGFDWLFYLEVTSPIVELPFGATDIVVDTTLTSDAGDTAAFQETFSIGSASPDYFPTISTTPAVLPPGSSTPLTQVVTDPMMSRVTVEQLSMIDSGVWDLSSFALGDTCGTGQVDFLYDDSYVFDLVVTSVTSDAMTAEAIVTSVAPEWLDLLISLSEPDPTGTSILTINYANDVVSGCTVSFGDHDLFPYGVPPQIGSALVVELAHSVPYVAPVIAGPVAVNTVVTSSQGDSAFLGETLFIGTPIDQFDRGDCNGDGGFDISDPVALLEALFVPGTDDPECSDACDSNDDGGIDIGDAVYKLNALFGGGPAPVTPHGACGTDDTDDSLDCANYASC